MKKLTFPRIKDNYFLIFCLILIIINSLSCDKTTEQEYEKDNDSPYYTTKNEDTNIEFQLTNVNNFFDTYAGSLKSFYGNAIFYFINAKNNNEDNYNLDFYESMSNFLEANDNNYTYPAFDTTCYSYEETILMKYIVDSLSLNNIIYFSSSFENQINSSRTMNPYQKQRLLEFISIYKFSIYYINNILPAYLPQSFDDLFDKCIREKLDDIFKDPWRAAEFIAGVPMSFMWIVVQCTVESINSTPSTVQ